jgi:serine/threonine protein kinase
VTGRQVALKVLHADLASDPNLSARFRREGATLASLRDPHTVATYELGETADGTLYIAMELLHGDSLWDRFRVAGTLPWRKVLTIVRGVLGSLAEAHALGIVHRDLKPANIHLEPAPEPDYVKVLDFGIAKLMSGSTIDDGSELTRVGTAVGTLDYMSPEQLVGGACDGRTDIYTLGVVMYEMITGQRPFADASGPTSLITALFTRTPTPPSVVANVPASLDAVILKCLEREAADRYADVDELRTAIDRLLVSSIARITTLPGHVPERVFGVEEITIRERPIAPELAAPDTDDSIPTFALGDEPTVIDHARLPTAPTEYAAGSEGTHQVVQSLPEDMWQGSNLTLVWPPVVPPVAPHDESQPFQIALGSTVGPPPLPPVGPSGTSIPSMSIAQIVLIGLFLLMIGMVVGVTIAYIL